MNQYSAKAFNTVDTIPALDWESLNIQNNTYFSPDFLRTFETSNPKIAFKYIVIYDKLNAVGLANIQIISLSIDAILKNIKISKSVKRIFRFFLCNYPLKIMFCGNVFLSGEHGIILNQDIDKKTGFHTGSVLVVPIIAEDSGNITGAIQMINKRNSDGSIGQFTNKDEDIVKVLANHVASFIRVVDS